MPDAFLRFRKSHEFWLAMVILICIAVLSSTTDSFFTLQNLFDLLTSYAFVFTTSGKYIYSLPDWFSKGIFWFEFEDANQISYGLNSKFFCSSLPSR
jgi:hypothetical protein